MKAFGSRQLRFPKNIRVQSIVFNPFLSGIVLKWMEKSLTFESNASMTLSIIPHTSDFLFVPWATKMIIERRKLYYLDLGRIEDSTIFTQQCINNKKKINDIQINDKWVIIVNSYAKYSF